MSAILESPRPSGFRASGSPALPTARVDPPTELVSESPSLAARGLGTTGPTVAAPLVAASDTVPRPRSAAAKALRALVVAPSIGLSIAFGSIAAAPSDDRLILVAAAVVAAAAGLSATTIGVFGGVLVPGLLLLGIEPRVAAPISLVLQVLVMPLGAASHAVVGHVERAITVPLIVGAIIGGTGGALVSSTVPAEIGARAVAFVIIVVGVIVLARLRAGYAAGCVGHAEVHAVRIGGIGTVAGFASGISGAGWGPIAVTLLTRSGVDPRHAVGSSLVGRIAMAVAALAIYGVSTAATGGSQLDLRLLAVLLAASAAAMVPGTLLMARLGRGPAAGAVAVLSIGLALPTLLTGGR